MCILHEQTPKSPSRPLRDKFRGLVFPILREVLLVKNTTKGGSRFVNVYIS